MKNVVVAAIVGCLIVLAGNLALTENKKEYQNQFRLMLDYAVRTNEYMRQRLGDKALANYAHAMAETNASEAEQMTPPPVFASVHPHFLLVLENIERSFFYVAKGNLAKYRSHQKIVRKELHLLEVLAERENLELYLWRSKY
jgi:hypothetical protein